jgi:diguanylate cyclase (GGDEF)-like protein
MGMSGAVRSRINFPARRNLPWLAMLGCAAIWLAVIVLAVAKFESVALLALGLAGLQLTALMTLQVRRAQDHLQVLARTDALTGLTNHGGFHQTLAFDVAEARRSGFPLALVSFDMDNFKAVNDTHGHPYGDAVLEAVGEQLRATLRPGDTAARTGGEEFALLLPQTSGEDGERIAEIARTAIARIEVPDVELSCSAGVAVYPTDAEDKSSLLELADAALYSAKRAGKERTRRFDSASVDYSGNHEQAVEIDRILTGESSLEIVYQPIAALATGQEVGYEALARFPDSPDRSPAAWFGQAHAVGKGAEFEAAAIRAAVSAPGRPHGTHLAVNVRPSVLSSEEVQGALPVDLSDIVIELTEHEAFRGDKMITSTVEDMRRRGARIALDDTGAGYAGLTNMVWLRPDIVKLDRELIRSIHADTARLALVESFVRFARQIGTTVCAEGIESFEDLRALANLDVACGQGYALARPGPPWPALSSGTFETCRSALDDALRSGSTSDPGPFSAGDRRLENLSAHLAWVGTRDDLMGALGLIAAELNADKICLSQLHSGIGRLETLVESGEQPKGEWFDLEEFPLTTKVVDSHEAVQVLTSDPSSDPDEVKLLVDLGYRSLLMVPVIQGRTCVGLFEALNVEERPWTRAEINKARIISNQFASVIRAIYVPQVPEL